MIKESEIQSPTTKCEGSGLRETISGADRERGMVHCPYCHKLMKVRISQAAMSGEDMTATLPQHKRKL